MRLLFFCAENRMWTGTPVKANTLDRAGDGQTSAPDFCIFASPLVLLPVFLRRTHKGKHACKNEHPERRRRRTAFRSRFLYFYIVPSFFSWGFFAKNTCWQPRPQKGKHLRQRRRLLSSCLRFPHRHAFPQTGRIFAGSARQTAGSG